MIVWSSPEPCVEQELDVRERLQPPAEARLRLPDALRDGADAAPVGRVEVEHAVGLAEADRAEHDGLGRVGAAGHVRASLGCGNGSRAGYALEHVMARIQIYTTRWCGYCVRAKALLDAKGLAYEEIALDDDPALPAAAPDLTGGWTVPQILIDGAPIGGYTELWRLERDGRLDELLAA